jgi:uncharacterized protein with von Willebrand factor type A (vWA) domain
MHNVGLAGVSPPPVRVTQQHTNKLASRVAYTEATRREDQFKFVVMICDGKTTFLGYSDAGGALVFHDSPLELLTMRLYNICAPFTAHIHQNTRTLSYLFSKSSLM